MTSENNLYSFESDNIGAILSFSLLKIKVFPHFFTNLLHIEIKIETPAHILKGKDVKSERPLINRNKTNMLCTKFFAGNALLEFYQI